MAQKKVKRSLSVPSLPKVNAQLSCPAGHCAAFRRRDCSVCCIRSDGNGWPRDSSGQCCEAHCQVLPIRNQDCADCTKREIIFTGASKASVSDSTRSGFAFPFDWTIPSLEGSGAQSSAGAWLRGSRSRAAVPASDQDPRHWWVIRRTAHPSQTRAAVLPSRFLNVSCG